MNCWLLQSPLQMALILVHVVAVPFLIVMIIIYVLYSFMWNNSFSCGIFCCHLIEGSKSTNARSAPVKPDMYLSSEDYVSLPFWTKRSADFPDELETNLEEEFANPSIAALLENLYRDDPQQIFKCAVALISNSWALTTTDCVGGVMDIRIGSNYWAKEGTVRKVKNIMSPNHHQNPALALVNFKKTDAKIAKMASIDDRLVSSFTWNGNNLHLPLNKRRKFGRLKRFNIELYQKGGCSNFGKSAHVSCYLASRGRHCNQTINAPLMDSANNLVGMHLDTYCPQNRSFAVVFYLDVYKYRDWLEKTIS